MDLGTTGIANRIVRLEPLDESHRAVVLSSQIADSVWKWMPALPGGSGLESYIDFMLKAAKAGTHIVFVVFLQETDEFAGVVGFDGIDKVHRRVRNALTWHPPHLVTPELYQAAQLLMIRRAYEAGAKRLEWRINPDNTFMMTHLKAIGPKEEARLRRYERVADGTWTDKIVYSLTRPEVLSTMKRLATDLGLDV